MACLCCRHPGAGRDPVKKCPNAPSYSGPRPWFDTLTNHRRGDGMPSILRRLLRGAPVRFRSRAHDQRGSKSSGAFLFNICVSLENNIFTRYFELLPKSMNVEVWFFLFLPATTNSVSLLEAISVLSGFREFYLQKSQRKQIFNRTKQVPEEVTFLVRQWARPGNRNMNLRKYAPVIKTWTGFRYEPGTGKSTTSSIKGYHRGFSDYLFREKQ